jgi:XTP/dITP diphosphohydrolase
VYVATTNAGKLHEMRALFDPTEFELATFPEYAGPVEGEVSYTENAALKAHTLHTQLRCAGRGDAVLADDSGLEVFALDRRPGVVTADYGGHDASWPQRRAQLLRELAATGSADRRARFVCALHYIGDDDRELATFATVEGELAEAERGVLGFSFDPIFVYRPVGKTFAELTDSEKNVVSHRAIAAAGLIAVVRAARRQLRVASSHAPS